MARLKPKPLVEGLRIDAGVVREQFDESAAFCPRLRHRPLHQLLADALAAAMRGDADVLDQRARGTLRAQTRQDAKLQAADNLPALAFRDHQLDVRIALDLLERLKIGRR